MNLIFLSYAPEDKYSRGGVTVLAYDLIEYLEFSIISLNPTRRKGTQVLQTIIDHRKLKSRFMKAIYWLTLVIKLALFFMKPANKEYSRIISCNIASSIMTSLFYPSKLIIWENVDYLKSRRLFNLLRIRFALSRGAQLIIASEAEYEKFNNFSWAKDSISFVANWTPEIRHRNIVKRIIGVGFLEPRKGFDLLLEYIDPRTFDDINLDIYGDGSQRSELSRLVSKRQLKNVNLRGYISDAYLQIEMSAGFILPSRFEGSPLTLIHAIKCGIPVAVSDKVSDVWHLKHKFPHQVFILELENKTNFTKVLADFMEAVHAYQSLKKHQIMEDDLREKSLSMLMKIIQNHVTSIN